MTGGRLPTAFLSATFVLIWASGFIVAGVVATRAEPLTFLAYRYALTIVVFVALSLAIKAAWPRTVAEWRNAVLAGMLLHGVYLGGVFWAVSRGLPAGMTALVTGLHPLLTALLAFPLLHERLILRQWIGIVVGILGIALIVWPKLGPVDAVPLIAVFAVLVATLALTLGTIWQKRSRPQMDLRVNAAIQFMGALVLTAPVAWASESGVFDASPALWGALAWAVLVLSVGGISILLVLLKRGAASKVAPLLYIAPAVAALIALFAFGETLGAVQVVGMVLAAAGAFAARH
jgi:drug/metabolite transporter (DMT)-like permease